MADLTEMVTAKEFGASAGSGFMILFLDLAVSPHATPLSKKPPKKRRRKGFNEAPIVFARHRACLLLPSRRQAPAELDLSGMQSRLLLLLLNRHVRSVPGNR
jgi:hypothetical protein